MVEVEVVGEDGVDAFEERLDGTGKEAEPAWVNERGLEGWTIGAGGGVSIGGEGGGWDTLSR